jgi:hypothetical protein
MKEGHFFKTRTKTTTTMKKERLMEEGGTPYR